jgi:transposase-like protein
MALKNEAEILAGLRAGKTLSQISRELGISPPAVYKSVKKLERDGKVFHLPGGGWEVAKGKARSPTPKTSKEAPAPARRATKELPAHVRRIIVDCEHFLTRARTLPREDVIHELHHLGTLRSYWQGVLCRDPNIYLSTAAAGIAIINEATKLAGSSRQIPQVQPESSKIVKVYVTVDYTGGVVPAKELEKLQKWENPATKRLLRGYIKWLKEHRDRPSSI